MNETLSPHEAARVLAEATRFEAPLLRRTEGLTWMVWGIATPGVFMTYAFAGVVGGNGWWMGLLWIPWILSGILATGALWRSAALAVPTAAVKDDPRFWAKFVGFTLLFTLLFYVLEPQGPEVPLMIVGGMWCGMGILNLWSSDAAGRIVAVLAGAPLVIAGVALAATGAPIEVSGTVALLISWLAPFGVGAWRAYSGG